MNTNISPTEWHPEATESLRKELGYYPEVPGGYKDEIWDNVVWNYVEKLEQEVIHLREKQNGLPRNL